MKKNNVYDLLLVTSVAAGHKIVGRRWDYNIKANNSRIGRVVVLAWEQLPGIDCGSTFAPVCRTQSIHMVLEIAAAYTLDS